ncbi:glycosyltransferase [Aminipila sp.]|uniref:glycosyltransferase n=1 Tax=Aminipila sp. TaxID=2060095 RepID=UPI00289847FD|nr:glycosyltransferase [Aminipila sp.]
MKKILYAASSYGHILSFHIPYIKQLEERGFIVHAAAAGASDNVEPQGTKKINIPFEKSMLSFKNISCTFQLMKLIKKERYDIISVHTSLAAFFVRLAVMLTNGKKPKVINTVHGYLFDENSPFLKRSILLWAEKFTKPVTDIVAVMNRQDYEIAEKYHLYKDKLIQIPGFGIDTEQFSRKNIEEKIRREQSLGEINENIAEYELKEIREKERKKLGFKEEDIVLAYAAEFSKRKNQKMLIQAMTKLPQNIKLFLAGKGDLLQECKGLAGDLKLNGKNSEQSIADGDRVFFLGHVKNLEYYYYLSDICVSASRSEGLPFNIMEAMAMGLPVVATDIKGHQDLVEQDINGYLYWFDNQNEAIEAVNKVLNLKKDKEKWQSVMQTNITKMQKYKLKEVRDYILELYINI